MENFTPLEQELYGLVKSGQNPNREGGKYGEMSIPRFYQIKEAALKAKAEEQSKRAQFSSRTTVPSSAAMGEPASRIGNVVSDAGVEALRQKPRVPFTQAPISDMVRAAQKQGGGAPVDTTLAGGAPPAAPSTVQPKSFDQALAEVGKGRGRPHAPDVSGGGAAGARDPGEAIQFLQESNAPGLGNLLLNLADAVSGGIRSAWTGKEAPTRLQQEYGMKLMSQQQANQAYAYAMAEVDKIKETYGVEIKKMVMQGQVDAAKEIAVAHGNYDVAAKLERLKAVIYALNTAIGVTAAIDPEAALLQIIEAGLSKKS